MIITIALIQYNIKWKSIDFNLRKLDSIIEKEISEKVNVVILPEMFNTGFVTESIQALSEPMEGKTVLWMKEISLKYKKSIMGSLIIKEDNKYYNRLIFVDDNQGVHFYDKRHLFSYGKEKEEFSKGKDFLIIDYKGWNICPLICYDLRFPVWVDKNIDLLIYVANWPESRNYAWESLLIARAIENQCYVAAVNKIGLDGLNVNHLGSSRIIDYSGNIISKTDYNKESILIKEISLSNLKNFRNEFPFYKDKDKLTIN